MPHTFANRLRQEARTGSSVELIEDEWRVLAQALIDDEENLESAFHEAAGAKGSFASGAENLTVSIPGIAREKAIVAVQRTVSFSLGAETRRVLIWALGFGSSRKRV